MRWPYQPWMSHLGLFADQTTLVSMICDFLIVEIDIICCSCYLSTFEKCFASICVRLCVCLCVCGGGGLGVGILFLLFLYLGFEVCAEKCQIAGFSSV